METKIDKNLPIPDVVKGRKPKYPFGDLMIGDSFFYDGDPQKVHKACWIYGKYHNKKFTCRKEKSGVRVWRIK